MGAAYFYHLTRRPLEVVLPQLLERALGQGWRVLVRGCDADRLAQIDESLWTFSDDGFLPHGIAGGKDDADHPVLLTTNDALPDDRACVMSIDGAAVKAEEVAAIRRACVLFDGADPAALAQARSQWRDLTQAGAAAQYWSEESGRWEKKAESA